MQSGNAGGSGTGLTSAESSIRVISALLPAIDITYADLLGMKIRGTQHGALWWAPGPPRGRTNPDNGWQSAKVPIANFRISHLFIKVFVPVGH